MKHEKHIDRKPGVISHAVFIGIGLVFLLGLYLYFRNMKPVIFGGILLVLVHIAIVLGILYLARRSILQLFLKFHGVSPAAAKSPGKLKSPETEGITIRWASFYDILTTVVFFGKEQKFRESIVELALIRPGEKILDVGCGTGSLTIAVKLKGGPSAEIHGIDAAPEMIERARQKANKAGLDIDFQTGLVEAIDFPDNTFDIVLSCLMVHHLPDSLKLKAFSEMHRVLRPGGRLLIVDFQPPDNRIARMFLILFSHHRMMKIDNSQLPPMLGEAGFTSVKIGNNGHSLLAFVSGMKTS